MQKLFAFSLFAILATSMFSVLPVVIPEVAALDTNGKIAFESTRDGNSETYVMNSDGSGQTNISNNAARDGTPNWSPDGTKIVFQSHRDSGPSRAQIYTMNADGTGVTRLTNNAASDAQADWGSSAITADTTPPTIIAPTDITVISKVAIAVALGTATATDTVDPNPVITNNAPSLFPIGTTTVTWTATDDSGNSATATQLVTVTTPAQATENLIDSAADLGAQTSSLGQVSQILNDNNSSNDKSACGKINAFINQVNANKNLTQVEKDQLIQSASEIKSSIGC